MRRVVLTICVFLISGAAMAQSVVPVRAIRAEQVVRPADVAGAQETWPGAITDITDAIGREARVTLYPGRPILVGDLAERAVIERNQVIVLQYAAAGLTIVTEGRALSRGRPGERIRAMNLSSRMTVWGRVRADGTLEVSP